jgi:arsenate reductase
MKILFLCTHNRCRSILAEALTLHKNSVWLQAKSAGSAPAGVVHPLTLHYLQEAGVRTLGLSSKSWYDLDGFQPNLIITLCDSAAGESCPVAFHAALKLHWPLSDPSKLEGKQAAAAFRACIADINRRLAVLENVAMKPSECWAQSLKSTEWSHTNGVV